MTESSSVALAAPPVAPVGLEAPGATPAKIAKGYTPALGAVNFGIYLALLTPIMVSLAFKVQHITASDSAATSSLGLIMGVGSVFALLANPLAGRLSDRTTSRWGMRRPWVLGGSIVGTGGLALMGLAQSVWVLLVAWCLVSTAMNAVLAAANATLPDQVPAVRRGKVSGIVGLTTPLGILTGTLLVNALSNDVARFVVPGLIGTVLAVLFVLVLKDRRLEHKPAQRFTAREFFGSFVFNPVKHRDFGWTWLTKFFVMFGYAGVATFLPFYLTDKFGLDEKQAISMILAANVASVVGMLISGPLGGILSDRIGKRRPFVAIAGIVLVVGLVTLALAPSVGVVILAQGIMGFGAGSFLSVDLALATQVLPNPEDTAKDLGVLNIANALPQALAPAIAPAIIAVGATTFLGGYTTWFLFGALVSLAGAVLVYRIKGVK